MNPNDFDDLLRIQRMMASKIMEESNVDSKIKIMNILRDMSGAKNKKIQVEEVIIETQSQGYSENETIRILEELIKDKFIIIPEEGFVKLT
jgi:DNA replicative helicase MCM subunit Mcm2 (Cdc46/Mcm family)